MNVETTSYQGATADMVEGLLMFFSSRSKKLNLVTVYVVPPFVREHCIVQRWCEGLEWDGAKVWKRTV